LRALVSTLQQENALLRQKIDALARRIFGSSSEKVSPAQLELPLQLASQDVSEPVTEAGSPEKAVGQRTCPDKQRAPRIPENLPVVEEVIEPKEVLAAPQNWRLIGQEVSEQLDYEPARFLRRRTVRRKYVHRKEMSKRCPRF
jgi:transposase